MANHSENDGAKLKILLGGFGLESSSFTPLIADSSAFVIRTEDFIPDAMKEYAQSEGAAITPLILIGGSPHGIVTKSYFEELAARFLDTLKANLPASGLILSMHGSMWVTDIGHGELELLKRVRAIVGEDFPIAVRPDLHGNIPEEFGALCTVITALRTAPHRDMPDTILRCCKLLLRIIKEDLQLHTAIKRLPLLLPGEAVVTESEPAKSLYAKLFELDTLTGIVSASIMVGFGWTDSPCAGASIIVSSSQGAAHANSLCKELGAQFMKCADSFAIEGEYGDDQKLSKLLSSPFSAPLFLSDSGDNVTAGSPGDGTYLLHQLLSHQDKKILFAQIWDEAAYKQIAHLSIGTQVHLNSGAQVLKSPATPVSVECTILAHASLKECGITVVRIGGLDVIITEKRRPIYLPQDFETIGVPLHNYSIIAVKLGYLIPELRDIAHSRFIVLSPGPSQLNLAGLSFSQLSSPIKIFRC